MKLELPWTEELVTRIFNEKMGWITNAKLSEEERNIAIEKLNEWKSKVLENVTPKE